jgi:HlyD family secretion protein
MNKKAKYGIGGVVLVGVVALAVVAANKNKTKATEVRIEGVEARDLVASVTASGQIQPRTKVDVSADVTGKIVRLVVKEGEMVSKGQLLLQIDPEQATAALQRAEASLASTRAQAAQARANLIQAQRNYERSLSIQKQSPNQESEEQLEQ